MTDSPQTPDNQTSGNAKNSAIPNVVTSKKAPPSKDKKGSGRNPFVVPVLVVINALSFGYYGYLAAPQYVSRAVVSIDNPRSSAPSMKSLLAGSSQSSPDGAYLVSEYSRDWTAYRQLDKALNLDAIWSKGDFLARYGSLPSLFQKSDTALMSYYKSHVKVTVDEDDGTASYTVTAFSPQDANRIERLLLENTQKYIDAGNVEEEHDYVASAQQHVEDARRAIVADQKEMHDIREKSGIMDPSLYYQAMLESASKMQVQELTAKAQYQSIISDTPNNPVASGLKIQMKVMNEGGEALSGKINGMGEILHQYEAVKSKMAVDQTLLSQAQSSLQQSEIAASQNHYYMHVVSAPSQPQSAEKPYSTIILGIIVILSLIIWFFS